MESTNHTQPSPFRQIALDDLPDADLRDALALAKFLHHQRIPFIAGAPSTVPALALEAAGIIRLHRSTDPDSGQQILEVR